MAEICEDVFYEVKKEVLDKLDIILQKVNLEIIEHLKPLQLPMQFQFIQLSSFETEISSLFEYLDRLYASLNSSVSFSSTEMNQQHSAHTLRQQNTRLHQQIQKLKMNVNQQVCQSSMSQPSCSSSWKNHLCRDCFALYDKNSFSEFQSKKNWAGFQETKQKLEQNLAKISHILQGYREMGKTIKVLLKDFKFFMIESRVESISRFKDLSTHRPSEIQACTHGQNEIGKILNKVNEILEAC